MSTPTPEIAWPLGHADAHDAADHISKPLASYPKARKLFRRDLAGRLVGSVDKADMMRRLDEFNVEFRQRLPAGGLS